MSMPKSIAEMARMYPYYVREHEDFRLNRPIGRGGFGVVWHAIDVKTENECAVKELFERDLDEKLEKVFITEVTTMAVCASRFICQLVGFTLHPPYYVITVFQPNGDLKETVIKHINRLSFSGTHLSTIALCIANGIDYMHQNGMLHRDLKSTNILMDKQQLPRIGDFGISRFDPRSVNEPLTRRIGTPCYMSPEIFLGYRYSKPSDIYSFGLILFEMAECHIPYEKNTREELHTILTTTEIDLPFTKITPKPLKELILRCLSRNINERPTAREIFESFAEGKAYFQNTNRNKIKKMAEKIDESDRKRRENPPPPPTQYCDVEELISKYKLCDRQVRKHVVKEEEEEEDKPEKESFVPIPPKLFYGRYHPSNESKFTLDENILADPSNPKFMETIVEYANNMTDANAYKFIHATMKYFNEATPTNVLIFFYKIYYICMQNSTKFIDLCYQFDFFNELLFNKEIANIRFELLVLLFKKRPILIDNRILPVLDTIKENVDDFCALYAIYVSDIPPLQFSIGVMSEFLKFAYLLTDENHKLKFINIIIYAFNKDKVLARSLSKKAFPLFKPLITSNDLKVVKEAYEGLIKSHIYNGSVPRETFMRHLGNSELVDTVLSYLIRCNNFPETYDFINALYPLMKTNPKAITVAIKAVYSTMILAVSVARDPEWMKMHYLSREDSVRLLLASLRYISSIDHLARNQFFPTFSSYIAGSSNPSALISLANILIMFLRSSEAIMIFTSSGALKEFFAQCSKSNDGNLLLVSLSLMDIALRSGYSSAFTDYIPKLIEMLRYQNDLTTRSIIIIVAMSGYPEGAAALKPVGLHDYFTELTKMPNYSSYAYQFLNNVR
jgi:serine/threonine protein kinase